MKNYLLKKYEKIKFHKSDNLIEIVEKNDNLILKLDTKIEKAILSYKKNILFEFDLQEIGKDSFAINEFTPRTIKESVMGTKYFNNEIYQSSSNLCMSILYYADFEGGLGKSDNFEMVTSLKLLSKDQRFRNTLQHIKNNFANNFYNFNNNFYNFENLSLI